MQWNRVSSGTKMSKKLAVGLTNPSNLQATPHMEGRNVMSSVVMAISYLASIIIMCRHMPTFTVL